MKTRYVPRKMNTDDDVATKKDVEREFREIGIVINRIIENVPNAYTGIAPINPQLGTTVFIYQGGWVPDDLEGDFTGDAALIIYIVPPIPRHGAVDLNLYKGKWHILSNFDF